MGALYLFLSFLEDDRMKKDQIYDRLERSPVIAATDGGWRAAVVSDAEVLFHTGASLLTVEEELPLAKRAGKAVFVHFDLAADIGRDAAGLQWLAACGTDGIISTRTQLIRTAHECGLLTVQRFFVLDPKGMHAIDDAIGTGCADLIEIMPGVISGAIMAFTMSLDDFVISYFVTGMDFITLPVEIYTYTKKPIQPKIYAMFTLLFLLIFVLMVVSNVIQLMGDKKKMDAHGK